MSKWLFLAYITLLVVLYSVEVWLLASAVCSSFIDTINTSESLPHSSRAPELHINIGCQWAHGFLVSTKWCRESYNFSYCHVYSVVCPEISSFEGGNFSFSNGHLVGSEVTYRCDDEVCTINGQPTYTRSCTETGWTNIDVVCECM